MASDWENMQETMANQQARREQLSLESRERARNNLKLAQTMRTGEFRLPGTELQENPFAGMTSSSQRAAPPPPGADIAGAAAAMRNSILDTKDRLDKKKGKDGKPDPGQGRRDAWKASKDMIARAARGPGHGTGSAGNTGVGGSAGTPTADPSSFKSRGARMKNLNPHLSGAFSELQNRLGMEFTVTSGYRSPKTNKGAKNSAHLRGSAFDVSTAGMSYDTRAKIARTWREILRERGMQGKGGVGVYNNSMHLDVENERAWGPNYSSTGLPANWRWAKADWQR